jgi:hypothetical protein
MVRITTIIRHWWITKFVTKKYLRACKLEQEAIAAKERNLGILRGYIADTGAISCGDLIAYEKANPPYLKGEEENVLKFTEDLRRSSTGSYFYSRINALSVKDALEAQDRIVVRLAKKHQVEIGQELKVHFKRKP